MKKHEGHQMKIAMYQMVYHLHLMWVMNFETWYPVYNTLAMVTKRKKLVLNFWSRDIS